ncbi:Endo-1,4-beta-xylanase A precursor [Arcticibacter svalbardensis MN12-7]|uniref:Beta-xylanase n=1 Tax=Arcticibacter svalbardensis MN12-7 TaxID=1150600 RepID=R9GRC9_9SPHI|nr:endo-1,4-beta-xylanase [Arcticibacter svalbardensis]EOR94243.1 Endo-1,4-beta-xylanase A precursor [Arcticibacter svalbardensis MN12-7]
MNNFKILLASLVVGCTSCAKNDSEPNQVTADKTISASNVTALKLSDNITFQNTMPFPIGVGINMGILKRDSKYRAIVVKEYNSISAETAMKMKSLRPSATTYSWSEADNLVKFAEENNKRVYGHALIWGNSLPDWVKNFKGGYPEWKEMFKAHITEVVKHFKGKVVAWDVINEAFADNGDLKNTIWRQKLGPNYIDMAFIFAHRADPSAILFINDYGMEYGNNKRRGLVKYVEGMIQRGIPIGGIATQFHSRVNLEDAKFSRALNEIAATGLKVHISEMEISLNPGSIKSLLLSSLLERQQAAKYEYIVRSYNALPKKQQFGITLWNVTDNDSWVLNYYNRPDWPLPFDGNYQKKPAYQGILNGVK